MFVPVTILSAEISDATAAGRAVLTAADAAAQRAALGLAAVAATGAYADLSGRPTLGTAAAQNTSAFLQPGNNLSDLGAAGTARTNLGLGSAATLNVPASGDAASGEVVKGSDARLSDARAPTAHTHTAAAVTDFAEAVDDRVAALLVAGANVTLTYDDAAGTLTVAAAGGGGSPGGADKQVQFNDGGAFGGIGTLTWDAGSQTLTLTGDSGDTAGKVSVTRGTGFVVFGTGYGGWRTDLPVPASSPGAVVRKIEIFDGSGSSLGFIPIYDAIS